jgi:hypothetical protein
LRRQTKKTSRENNLRRQTEDIKLEIEIGVIILEEHGEKDE